MKIKTYLFRILADNNNIPSFSRHLALISFIAGVYFGVVGKIELTYSFLTLTGSLAVGSQIPKLK